VQAVPPQPPSLFAALANFALIFVTYAEARWVKSWSEAGIQYRKQRIQRTGRTGIAGRRTDRHYLLIIGGD
jgi:hypothetical protein